VVGGRRVPKGWRVQLMLGQAQKDIQEFSEDSEAFRPERCALHAKRQGVAVSRRLSLVSPALLVHFTLPR
jgi:hypothetical protein